MVRATAPVRCHGQGMSSRACSPDRVRHLHLVAAARAAAVRPTNPQQVADIVRVTVDEEVDTGTFAAIVSDVSADTLR